MPSQLILPEFLLREPRLLDSLCCGIEKESLRVTPEGYLSERGHPPALGSALTHPNITTDFSEAQLELITSVHPNPDGAIAELRNVHRFIYQNLGDELLWAGSMPCMLGSDDEIPVGRYGSSNIATAKTVYRLGLGNRYGRLMQTISGIHYNFSVPELFWAPFAASRNRRPGQAFQTESYFGLIRNFRRTSWLLIYLFGASPAICKSFIRNKAHRLEVFDEGSLYLPLGTSLRMGRLGYQSDAQSSLHISYNSLDEYADSMHAALTHSYPPYEKIGVKVDGQYRQLNTALLQIENEFYGTIRPKRPVRAGERPLTALRSRGVEYVEVRCLDLNPFLPEGIDAVEARFINLFLLYCLLSESPPDSELESEIMATNQLAVVERGRAPGLTLETLDGSTAMTDWAGQILHDLRPLADLLDRLHGSDLYTYSLDQQAAKVKDPDLTPSARMLHLMRTQHIPYFRFTMNQSIAHKGYFDEHPLRDRDLTEFQRMAEDSLAAQRAMEAADDVDFDTFLQDYLAFK
ncbi:MAG TPA: glutamate--cysteine ligase [Pseudomonadales bacterium]